MWRDAPGQHAFVIQEDRGPVSFVTQCAADCLADGDCGICPVPRLTTSGRDDSSGGPSVLRGAKNSPLPRHDVWLHVWTQRDTDAQDSARSVVA
jgi:hypothetical protein